MLLYSDYFLMVLSSRGFRNRFEHTKADSFSPQHYHFQIAVADGVGAPRRLKNHQFLTIIFVAKAAVLLRRRTI